jgi:hypothetical protein
MANIICTVLLVIAALVLLAAAFGLASGGSVQTLPLGLALAAIAALAWLLKLP